MSDTIYWGLLAIAVIVIWTVCYGLFIVPTRWLKVERVRHPIGIHKKILQISDLHVEHLRISASRLARVLHEEQPDYILMTGDFTQHEKYLQRLRPYLQLIMDSGIPAYAVLGNHDYKIKRTIRLIRLLDDYGIPVLRNSSVVLDGFILLGIDDFYTGHSRVEKAYRSMVRHDLPILIMTHDPNLVLYVKRSYSYLVSGHLHGKQIAVPFLFKLRPMGRLPDMGIYKGLHHDGNGTYYISKGISQTGYNIRLFVRSEVTVHEL